MTLEANSTQASTISDDIVRLQGKNYTELLRRYEVDANEFETHLRSIGQEQPIHSWVPSPLVLDDLLLAFGCSRGQATALSDFNEQLGPIYDSVCAKLRIGGAQRSDARQRLWQTLFVGHERTPKIDEYHGRGRLAHWFRVTVSRFLLNEIRAKKRDRLVLQPDHGELDIASGKDPELAYLEQTYRKQFQEAFHQALASLRPDQRNILRCHYIHCMNIDQMADFFGVHRATAARRIANARNELLTATCSYLRTVLGCDTEEIQSVIRRIDYASSLSISRLLGSD